MENIELVNHVKSAFGALQIVPGAVQAIKPLVSSTYMNDPGGNTGNHL